MTVRSNLYLPAELAELLHATLGPLADILHRDGHDWAPMLHRVLREYTRARNSFLAEVHGDQILPEVSHLTYLASEKVCALADLALREEQDFVKWASEVDGDSC